VLGRVVAPHAWAGGAAERGAWSAADWVGCDAVGAYSQAQRAVSSMVWAFVINLLVSPVFYLLVPVCGRRFAFPMFPLDPGHVVPHMVRIDATPDGMPSLHLSTALLTVWFSRRNRAGFVLAMVYLLLIVVSALASGQHYGVNLVAAIPYTSGIIRLAKGVWLRSKAVNQDIAATTELPK